MTESLPNQSLSQKWRFSSLWVAETSSRNEVVDSVVFVPKLSAMFAILSALLRCLLSWVRPKHELELENLALRHQIAVLHRGVHKPRLQGKDRLFWVVLKRWWPNWRAALILFQPETVIGWQRAGFRMFWRWKSLSLPENPSMARTGVIQSCQLT